MKCTDIGFGTYDCAYNIMLPYFCKLKSEDDSALKPKYISIDKCLLPEILLLWEKGIRTTGCCCGHGKLEPYISVTENCVEHMVSLGYKHQSNPLYQNDDTMFCPKTVLQYDDADKGFNWFDETCRRPHDPKNYYKFIYDFIEEEGCATENQE